MSARRQTWTTTNPNTGRVVTLPLTVARVRELRRLGFEVSPVTRRVVTGEVSTA